MMRLLGYCRVPISILLVVKPLTMKVVEKRGCLLGMDEGKQMNFEVCC